MPTITGTSGADTLIGTSSGTYNAGDGDDIVIALATGNVIRTIESNRFVTGVTWVDGELWHGTYEDEIADVRRIDPKTGAVLTTLAMPAGTTVSGLESDGKDLLFAGGGRSAKIRAVRRRGKAA